jgi:hypothetical protein
VVSAARLVTEASAESQSILARYFFHVEHGGSFLDKQGVELPNLHAARVEAVRLLGELLRDEAHRSWDCRAVKLSVTDENHLILFALDLSGIVAPASASNRH